MTRTREEALAGAARCIVEGLRVSDSLPIEEAARRAMHAGGPPFEEVVDLIRARRARLGMTDQEPPDPTAAGAVAPERAQLLPLATHTTSPKEGTHAAA